MTKVFLFFLFGIISVSAWAQTVGTPYSPAPSPWGTWTNNLRTPLDNFCPRLEGVHLQGCCPPVTGVSTKCYYETPGVYYTYQRSSETVANPQYNDPNNPDVMTSCTTSVSACCEQISHGCFIDITKQFIPRLITDHTNKNNTCRFESCPPPNYWSKASPPVPSDYVLVSAPNPNSCATAPSNTQAQGCGGLGLCGGGGSCPSTGGGSSGSSSGSSSSSSSGSSSSGSGSGSGSSSGPPPPPPAPAPPG